MPPSFHVILVEDDPEQQEDLSNEIKNAVCWSLKCDVEVTFEIISCEVEFVQVISSKLEMAPSLVVIDLMLEWKQPWIELPIELNHHGLSMNDAGGRCVRLLRDLGMNVPVLLWTMTDQKIENLADISRLMILRKDRAVEDDLYSTISKLLRS